MPEESSQTNQRNIADSLSQAAGVTPTPNSDKTDEEATEEEDQPKNDSVDANMENKSERVREHLQDKRSKTKKFKQHFGERGDNRRSGLRIEEGGEYEWAAMGYKHDTGVTVFRLKRAGDELEREKDHVPLEKLIELNPDPNSHSRLKEIQAYGSETDVTTEELDEASKSTASQQSKNINTATKLDDSDTDRQDTVDDTALSEEKTKIIRDTADSHNLSGELKEQLVDMIRNSESEYTEAMIENVAAGLKEHERVSGESSQKKEQGQTSEATEIKNSADSDESQKVSSAENYEANTRAKRAIEDIAAGEGPVSKEAAQSIRDADTEEMQKHYKKTREKQKKQQTQSDKSIEEVGIAERIGSQEGGGEKKSADQSQVDGNESPETEPGAERIHAQEDFFALAVEMLERMQYVYESKDAVSEDDKKKYAAIKEALQAYRNHQQDLHKGKAVSQDKLKKRVTGLNKAVNAHQQLREQHPDLIQRLQEIETKLSIEL